MTRSKGCEWYQNGECTLGASQRRALATDAARRKAEEEGHPARWVNRQTREEEVYYSMPLGDRLTLQSQLSTLRADMQEQKGDKVMCSARGRRNPGERAELQRNCSAVRDGRAKIIE